jgi:hypothetical protein
MFFEIENGLGGAFVWVKNIFHENLRVLPFGSIIMKKIYVFSTSKCKIFSSFYFKIS